MRVLIISPYYFPYTSGMTVYAQRLAEGLAERGHSVKVLTHNHNHFAEKEKLNGVEVFRVPALVKFGRGIFSPRMTEKFIKLVEGVDIVNIHAPFFECGLLASLAKKKGKKVFLTYHCDLILTGLLSPFVIDRFHKLSLNQAAKNSDAIIMNSLVYAEGSYLKNFISKIIPVPPPSNNKKFFHVSGSKFRKLYSIRENDFVAGFIGRLTYEKGLENLIRAAKLLEGKIKNLKILIAGEGVLVAGGEKESAKENLERLTEKLNLKNIIFTGKIPDNEMNEFFSSLDVFVLPSINRLESFGMTQVEAMLCGRPVVASNIAGVSEAVGMTGFGMLAEPNIPEDLAEKIFHIYSNRKKYLPNRKKIVSLFGMKKFLDSYDRIFSS